MERVLKSLMNRKDEIEREIATESEVLRVNNIGMSEPLVDSEGFPRNDIDVFQVRTARQRIICLQNDYKEIMSQIEKGLHKLHEKTSSTVMQSNTKKSEDLSNTDPKPFAVIKSVERGSPSDIAGFRSGDKIVSFGSLTAENFSNLTDMVNIISHSVNNGIDVEVIRSHTSMMFKLSPQKWSGNGLVGWRVDVIAK